jgi:hypothetical protein
LLDVAAAAGEIRPDMDAFGLAGLRLSSSETL